MVKEVYYCDICEKEYSQTDLQKMKIPYTKKTQEGTSLELREIDCCLDCCFKLAVLLKEQKFVKYEEESSENQVEQVESEIVE